MLKHNDPAALSCRTVPLLYLFGLLLGFTCAWTGWHYKQQKYLQFQAVEKHYQATLNHYLAAHEEARLVREYYPYVLELRQRGYLGQERRLDWIEALQRSGKRLGLSVLNYRIGAQDEYKGVLHNNGGTYKIYYSPMRLDINLLHEGELFEFFAYLDSHAPGIYTVRSCKLSRLREDIDYTTVQDNIRTECELLWFSIKKQDGGVIDLS